MTTIGLPNFTTRDASRSAVCISGLGMGWGEFRRTAPSKKRSANGCAYEAPNERKGARGYGLWRDRQRPVVRIQPDDTRSPGRQRTRTRASAAADVQYPFPRGRIERRPYNSHAFGFCNDSLLSCCLMPQQCFGSRGALLLGRGHTVCRVRQPTLTWQTAERVGRSCPRAV